MSTCWRPAAAGGAWLPRRDTLTEAQLLELGKKFEQAKSQLQPSI